MELIYTYIKKFGGFIKDQEIVLSNNFDINISNKILEIKEKTNELTSYYGKDITNISMFVGKNGTGKTTLLDIFGMKRDDRLTLSTRKGEVLDEYLLIYYLGKDEAQEDIFEIEIFGFDVFDDVFTNYYIKEDVDYDKSKCSICKVFMYKNNTFISLHKYSFNYVINNVQSSDIIQYAYINESYRYSNRNKRYSLYNDKEYDYVHKRRMMPKVSTYEKYLTLVSFMKNDIEGFNYINAKIMFYDDIDYDYGNEKFESSIDSLEEKLKVWKKIDILKRKEEVIKQEKVKEKYIYDIYSRYLIDLIFNGLSYCCESNKKSMVNSKKTVNCLKELQYIYNLEKNDNSIEIFGEPVNFYKEIEEIEVLIDKVFSLNFDILSSFKIIGRYIGSRVNADINLDNFLYVEMIESIVELLFTIPEEYFTQKGLEFELNIKTNKYLKNLLEKYDYYVNKGKDGFVNIENKFKINFEMLSEGEQRFIDIIAKVNRCMAEQNGEKLLLILLDEPDQALHPEWSRRFMDIITSAIEKNNYNKDIQLIITTHSPYLLSDMLPSNVFLLDRDNDDKKLSIQRLDKKEPDFSCFGANIYDLMQNNFFMNNTVGEFATKKINDVARQIDKLSKENIDDIVKIEFIIDNIGEPLLKNALKIKLNQRRLKINMKNKKSSILNVIENEEDRKRVEKYLSQLENEYDKN